MSIISLHNRRETRDLGTMTCDNDHDRFYRNWKHNPCQQTVIVIVNGHSQKCPEVPRPVSKQYAV